MKFSHELAMALYQSEDQFPVDFDKAWRWIGWPKKQHGKDVLLNNFTEEEDFLRRGVKSSTGGRPSESIWLTVNCFKKLAMMAGTEQGDQVREYFIACEQAAKGGALMVEAAIAQTKQVVNVISEWLIEAGVNSAIASMWKLDQLGRRHPELKPETESAKQLIGGANATESQYLTPTELGDRIGIKSRAVNTALVEAGLQVQLEDGKGKKKWNLTDEGKKYGIVFLASGQNNRWSGGQIKWLPTVLDVLNVQQSA